MSEASLLFSFEQKNERNLFLNSALGSKFFYLTHFRSLRQKSKNNFVRFLVQMRTRKFASEIYWPLQHLTQKIYKFQSTPLSLSFMARKALRMKLQSEGCYDFKNNSVVLELPKPLKEYIFFDDLDVKEMCKLYRQSDCGCQTIKYKSNCPRNSWNFRKPDQEMHF